MAYSAAAPVSEALFGLLQDATLLATLTGGWFNDVPQDPTYPFGWLEVGEPADLRGFGTGELPRVEFRTHVFARRGGSLAVIAEMQEANRLTRSVIQDQQPTVTGYNVCGHIFWRETSAPLEEELNGVKVWEIVSTFDVYVERS